MKTSLRFAAMLLTVLLCLPLAACAPDTDLPDGMIRATDGTTDFDLFVPDDWTVDLTGAAVSAYKSASDPTSVSVMSWALPHADSTVGDWWETYKSEFEMVFSEFTLETDGEDTLLDGAAAKKYVYTGRLGENTYRYTQLASARGGIVYLLTVTEITASGVDHTEDIDKITENFRWK